MKTILAPGAPWPKPKPKPKQPRKTSRTSSLIPAGVRKATAFRTYLEKHPGSYTIQVATALKIDYGVTQRALYQMTKNGALRCENTAYWLA